VLVNIINSRDYVTCITLLIVPPWHAVPEYCCNMAKYEMPWTFNIYETLWFLLQCFAGPGKPEGKKPLGRPRRRWEDNIKMDLQEVGGGRGDWMELAQNRERWRALVGTVRDFRVP